MTTPAASKTAELTESPSAEAVLEAARQLVAAVVLYGRTEGERARAEAALAHLDDVWPLRAPIDATGVEERGAILIDEAMSALVTVVAAAQEAQARARGLRALELLTSNLDLPGDLPSGQP